MTTVACEAVHSQFDAFVDGELPGTEMLRVSQHLDACQACAETVADLREVGDVAARGGLGGGGGAADARPRGRRGLAESPRRNRQSWRGAFRRGVDDWHWVIVGGGSVAATFVSVVFAAALLLFGPVPVREDSLSALDQQPRRARRPAVHRSDAGQERQRRAADRSGHGRRRVRVIGRARDARDARLAERARTSSARSLGTHAQGHACRLGLDAGCRAPLHRVARSTDISALRVSASTSVGLGQPRSRSTASDLVDAITRRSAQKGLWHSSPVF